MFRTKNLKEPKMLIPSLSNTTPPSFYQFETISGVDYDKKLEKVKNMFDLMIIPSHGEPAKTLWNKIETGEDPDIGCRLFYANHIAVGISVFKRRNASALENQGLKNPYSIEVLATTNTSSIDREMLLSGTVELLSKEHNADGVYIKIPKERGQDVAYFVEKGFQARLSSSEKTHILCIKQLSSSQTSKKTEGMDPHEKRKRKAEPADVESSKIPAPLSKTYEKLIWISVKENLLNSISSGIKTIEGRINSGRFCNLKVGEQIKFYDKKNRKVLCEVIKVCAYKTFNTMLEREGFKNCFPDVKTLEEGVAIYNNIRGYPQRAAESGVLAIKFQVVKE